MSAHFKFERKESDFLFQAPGTKRLSVKSFGAVGDGARDDSGAVQTAVTAASRAQAALYVPDGQYKLTRPIALPSGTNIICQSRRTQFIRAHATPGPQGATFINLRRREGDRSISLAGGTIRAQKSTCKGKQIYFENVSGVQIHDLDIGLSRGDWMTTLKNCSDFSVQGGSWNADGAGMYVDGLHIYGSRRGSIRGMQIFAGDDALAITVEAPDCGWSEDIHVRDCSLVSSAASALKIAVGPAASAGVRRVHLRRLKIVHRSVAGAIPVWMYNASPRPEALEQIFLAQAEVDCQRQVGTAIRLSGARHVALEDVAVKDPNGAPLLVEAGPARRIQTVLFAPGNTSDGVTLAITGSSKPTVRLPREQTPAIVASLIHSLTGVLPKVWVIKGGYKLDFGSAPGWRLGAPLLEVLPTSEAVPGGSVASAPMPSRSIRVTRFNQVGEQNGSQQPCVKATDVRRFALIDCSLTGATGDAVVIGNSDVPCSGVVIKGSVIAGASNRRAINISHVRGYRIENNFLRRGSAGILVAASSSGSSIRNAPISKQLMSKSPGF